MNKKNILINRLFEEDIDIACIQETHLCVWEISLTMGL